MIPTPPLTESGELPETLEADVRAALVSGVLSACGLCGHGTIWHWPRAGRYAPLHPHCVDKVVDAWREMAAEERSSATPPSGRLTGAYARRAQAAGRPDHRRSASASLGSPFFIPGMPEGAPWVAVARMGDDGVSVVCPCELNEGHARKVNRHYRALTLAGYPILPGRFAVAGHVLDPTGAISDPWTVE